MLAALRYGAKEIVDPRPFAVGSIAETYRHYGNTGPVIPAMGYSGKQVSDLEKTINRIDCDLVLIGTPVDLRRVIKIKHPTSRVSYELQEIGKPDLSTVLLAFLSEQGIVPGGQRGIRMRAV